MSTSTKLDKDEKGKCVDIKSYRGLIGSLLYLTASRPDIMFCVCLCAKFQSCPKESNLHAVERIFIQGVSICRVVKGELVYWRIFNFIVRSYMG